MLSLLPFLVAILYYLCFALLLGLVTVIAAAPLSLSLPATKSAERSKVKNAAQRPLDSVSARRNGLAKRRFFFLLALSLLLWQLTLFLETRTTLPLLQLWLGRINFAAVAVAVFFSWGFVQHVAQQSAQSAQGEASYTALSVTAPSLLGPRWLRYSLYFETAFFALLTLLTPLIDEAESIVAGHPVTQFGPLFPYYLLHILGYLVATLILAFAARGRSLAAPTVRRQLTVIGVGILATGGVALITNALLPYGFDDFRFCDIGALSTLFFLLSVAYAVFVHGLFDLRIVLRETLVYGLLLAVVLGGYSSAVFVATQYLTGGTGADKLTQFMVLLIAFSFDPLRRYLEEKTDILLFGKDRGRRRRRRRSIAASLFSWRRE